MPADDSPAPTGKRSTSMWLSEDARRRLLALAEELNLTQAAVVELALRVLAKREGVK